MNKATRRIGQIKQKNSKIPDLAALLPIIGICLFATPLATVFAGGADEDLSTMAFYIFSMWGALIFMSFILSAYIRHIEKKNS